MDELQVLRSQHSGYCSDEEPNCRPLPNMSIFKEALQMEQSLNGADKVCSKKKTASSSHEKVPWKHEKIPAASFYGVEVHSGLRIRDMRDDFGTLAEKLSDLRFIKLQSLKIAAIGDGVKGAWATIGVVSEKGHPKVSSNGKNYGIWKLTSLDMAPVSLFLFGDAYSNHWREPIGSIVAVFGANVRLDKKDDFSLSIFGVNQLIVIGTSTDFGICSGSRKDGSPCTLVVDRRQGNFCKFHVTAAQNKLRTKRPELTGGVLSASPSTFRITKITRPEVEEPADKLPMKRVRPRSSSELTKMLSNPEKLTTRSSSQGLRFLASLTSDNVENKPVATAGTTKKQKLDVKKQKLEIKSEKTQRSALAEVPNGRQRGPNTEVIELDLDVEDDAMLQALTIFHQRAGQ